MLDYPLLYPRYRPCPDCQGTPGEQRGLEIPSSPGTHCGRPTIIALTRVVPTCSIPPGVTATTYTLMPDWPSDQWKRLECWARTCRVEKRKEMHASSSRGQFLSILYAQERVGRREKNVRMVESRNTAQYVTVNTGQLNWSRGRS